MKTILIINTPEDFDYRRCSIGGDGNIYYEREGEQRTSIIGNIKNLKPMPERRTPKPNESFPQSMTLIDRWRGFDECIDEILGEEVEEEKENE